MKVVIAPDSFKGSLSARQVAEALALGWRQAWPESEITVLPMADGGEGTLQALIDTLGGELVAVPVHDPLGRRIGASFGMLPPVVAHGPMTAVVEMAAASGLHHVVPAPNSAAAASTYGTGELFAAALDLGARRILLTLGGSATTDGGAGMAEALGARLLDAKGRHVEPGGAALRGLADIDVSGLDPRLAHCEVMVVCDVDNPLTGPRGAAAVFGPQKGADARTIADLEAGLVRLEKVCVAAGLGSHDAYPGAGAAGGLGYGALTFLRSHALTPGFELVADIMGLDRALAGADLVITGEGRLDLQSLAGKTPIGVARHAATFGVPVVAVAGEVTYDATAIAQAGITAALSILPGPCLLEEALAEAYPNLVRTGAQLARLWNAAPC